MSKLLVLSRFTNDYKRLVEAAKLPSLESAVFLSSTDDLSNVKECDIVFGEPRLIRAALDSLPKLRWAQSMMAGVEVLLGPSLRRDYALTNARAVFGGLMSEYVIGYLLQHERRIFERYRAQKEHRWDGSLPGYLRGKTIGLLGVGSIGAELARTAKFFGMTVRGFTRSSESCTDVDAYFHGDDLIAFANGLDYLVSILPSTAETRHVVNADLLSVLPAHAVFINVGRGSAVDEPALVDALEKKKIAGAVLDVFEEEPLPKEHPFWDTPNLLMTYHTSAPSLPEDIFGIFEENYRRYARGEQLKYKVDFERGY